MNRIAKTRQAGLLTAAEQESLHELRLEFGWPVPASFFLDDEEEPAGDEPLFSPEHIEALQPLLGVQRRLVVDIGSGCGRSTEWWCRSDSELVVVAVDHGFGEAWERLDDRAKRRIARRPAEFSARLEAFRSRVVPVRLSSTEALCRLAELRLTPDIVYCDGSVLEGVVSADVRWIAETWPQAVLCGSRWSSSAVRVGVTAGLREVLGGPLPSLLVTGNVWRLLR